MTRRRRGSWSSLWAGQGQHRKSRAPCWHRRTGKLILESSSSDASKTTEDHQNEGFLKSIWHNLTNHPAHRQGNETEGKTDDSNKKDGEKKD